MRRKAIISILVTILAVSFMCPSISARQSADVISGNNPPPQFRWQNISSISVTLRLDGSTAYCSGTIIGQSGTTGISASMVLERKIGSNPDRYEHVKTWTGSSSTSTLSFNESWPITSGQTYRLTVTAKVTRNGTTETGSNWIEKP